MLIRFLFPTYSRGLLEQHIVCSIVISPNYLFFGFIDLVYCFMSFIDFLIRQNNIWLVWSHAESIQLFVIDHLFQTSPGKK